MKIIKGLAVLVVTLSLGSCFDPPEFPVAPQIDYEDVVFKERNTTTGRDSLIVTLKFKDGDGDLGVDATDPQYNNAPYNNLTFFQTNDADKANLIALNTSQLAIDHIKQGQKVTENFHLLQIPNPAVGKLVFPRTRKQSGYEFLPAFGCENYEFFRTANYAIRFDEKAVLDATAVVDTLFTRIENKPVATHFVIRDTLYFQVNQNHYNIDVDFMVKEPGNPDADKDGFVVFNWRKAPFCQQDLDGRLPILSDKTGPLEGQIRYAMTSIGFRNLFTIKTLKLRIKVRDRALNESNTVFTKEFTL